MYIYMYMSVCVCVCVCVHAWVLNDIFGQEQSERASQKETE